MKKLLLSIALMLLATSMFAITSGYTVYVKFAVAGQYNAYAWDNDGANKYAGNWPGTEVAGTPDANGYYSFVFPDGVDAGTAFIIFNQGSSQTGNLAASATTYYNVAADFSVTLGLVTAEPTLLAPEKSVIVVGNTVKVASASAVEIINISGVTVQSSVVYGEFVSNPLSAGLYIVVVDGKATKVLIK